MMRRYPVLVVFGLCGVLLAAVAPAKPPAPAPAPAPPQAAVPAGEADVTPPAGPGPHIIFDSVLVTIGDVVHGQDAVATFGFRNTGDEPLHILSAKPG